MPTKAELRKHMLELRKNLPTHQVTENAQTICQHFFDSFRLEEVTWLHIFLSIPEMKELDTWPIIQEIWKKHPQVNIAVPVTLPKAENLIHRQLTPTTKLIKSKWGIDEPDHSSRQVQEQDIDLVLVPLLAFDLQGHRVGYGKGYYDRFLQQCRPEVKKIGLSLFEPVDKITDAGPWDVPLDYCISPNKVYRF